MTGASKVLASMAGGPVLGPGASTMFVEESAQSLLGDLIQSHGLAPHAAADMVEGSATVFVESQPACRNGDAASCGHLVTLGSETVFINT